jgi:hypothetical protein
VTTPKHSASEPTLDEALRDPVLFERYVAPYGTLIDDDIEFAPGLPKVAPAARLRLRSLATVQPRQVRWLVPGLIPLRTLTLVAGIGGLGKSTWLANVAAQVSRGSLLDGKPGNVIIVSYEDAAEEILRPRVDAAGGDLDRVYDIVLEGVAGIDPVQLPRDIDELERLVHGVEARLVIVDPIVAAFDTALDAHKDQHVRHVLAMLTKLAEETSCALPIVGHLNKTPSSDAYIRVANSVAFWNASRSVVLVTEDEGDHRLVAQRKANYARLHPVERHRIEEIVLPGTLDPDTGLEIVTSRMVFVEFAEDVDSADVLTSRRADGGEKETKAAAFLAGSLWDGEWDDSAGVKASAAGEGISERTLQRAAKDLGVEADWRGFPASTWWRLASRAKGTPKNDGATVEPASLSQKQGAVAPVAPDLFGDATDGATTPDEVE